jgi:hypothetical protein
MCRVDHVGIAAICGRFLGIRKSGGKFGDSITWSCTTGMKTSGLGTEHEAQCGRGRNQHGPGWNLNRQGILYRSSITRGGIDGIRGPEYATGDMILLERDRGNLLAETESRNSAEQAELAASNRAPRTGLVTEKGRQKVGGVLSGERIG